MRLIRITPAQGAEESSSAPGETAGARGGKDPFAVALGRRGGLKGGKRSLETMTADARRERARHAARVRWTKAIR